MDILFHYFFTIRNFLLFIRYDIIHSLFLIRVNLMNRRNYLYAVLISIFVLTGCSEPATETVNRMIDNPTDKEITVTIDSNSLTIPAKSSINHEFTYGKHSLSYDGDSVEFFVKPNGTDGFINPTQSNYLIYKVFYVDDNDKRINEQTLEQLDKQTLSKTKVIVNGQLVNVNVPFAVVNGLFIENGNVRWDYFVGEPFPEEVSLGRDYYQVLKSKLFREDEFFHYIESEDADMVGAEFKLPNNKIKFSEMPKIVMPEVDVDRVVCTEGKTEIKEIIAAWNKLPQLSGKEFASLYNDVSKKSMFNTKLQTKCEEGYNGDKTYYDTNLAINQNVFFILNSLNFYIIE